MTLVLLVEDNQAVLESVALELEISGYEVITAEDGLQALARLENAPRLPDVVVSDIAMPRMDGYALLDRFRQDDRLIAIPFIFLTAFNEVESVRRGKEQGVDEYLTKPFQIEDLVIAIENKLRRVSQLQRDNEHRLDAVRRELIKVVSHELRTPLASIYGGLEMLAEKIHDLPDAASQRMLTHMRGDARAMARLVSQLLLLVEVDSGHTAQLIERAAYPCDMGEVVYMAVQMAQHDRDPGLAASRIRMDLPRVPLYVRAAQEFLIRATAEVIHNAVGFSQPGSEVTVKLRQESDVGVITVIDRGSGIAPDKLPHVWERFTTFSPDQFGQQGAGLGLALVRECVALHDGDCAIDSVPGRGTRVMLRLPLVPSPED